jgi:hypothetical protein
MSFLVQYQRVLVCGRSIALAEANGHGLLTTPSAEALDQRLLRVLDSRVVCHIEVV